MKYLIIPLLFLGGCSKRDKELVCEWYVPRVYPYGVKNYYSQRGEYLRSEFMFSMMYVCEKWDSQ